MINLKVLLLITASLFLTTAPTSSLIWSDGVKTPSQVELTKQKSDQEITKAIKNEIQNDKDFAKDTSRVDIKTEQGKVTLSGSVSDADTKADVESVAKDIAGDNNVVNNIVVENNT